MESSFNLENPAAVRQIFTPANIAIFTSVGLHAFILGLVLPNFYWNDPTPPQEENRENVGVIELTPAEQSRLPNTSPVPNLMDSFPGALANPALPGFDTSLPPLPGGDYNYSSLPNINGIPLPPSLPNLPGYPSNLPPLSSYGNLSNLPIATPPISLPPLPPRRFSGSSPSLPPLPPDTNNQRMGRDNLTAPQRPNFGELPPSRGTDFITRGSQNPSIPPVDNEQELQAEGQDTSVNLARKNDLLWQAQQRTNIKERLTLTGTYPRIACRNQTEATVVYNVSPDQTLTPISTSRFPIFNQLAEEAIRGQGVGQPTQVSVEFRYDPAICGAVRTPSTPSNNSSGQSPSVSSPSPNTPTPFVPPSPQPRITPNTSREIIPSPRSLDPIIPAVPVTPTSPTAPPPPSIPVTPALEVEPSPVPSPSVAAPVEELPAPQAPESRGNETSELPGPALGKKE